MQDSQNEFKWTVKQYIAAFVISGASLFLIYAQSFKKDFIVDKTTVMLLGIAILPWLSLFFKKGKIGDIAWDNEGKSQGRAEKIPPPNEKKSRDFIPEPGELSSGSKKILRTLWRYQKATFKDDFSKRWTFIISPASSEFLNYLGGLAPLVANKLVVVSPENHQCMLSNEGILYVEKNRDLQEGADYYYF